MAGFRNFYELQQAMVTSGKRHSATFRKLTTVATTAGVFVDMSYGTSGHPVSNFYASSPLVAAVLLGREGIQHGQAVSPDKKFLKSVTAYCSSAGTVNLLLADYLLYYPFIDGDSTDEQTFVNYGEDSPPIAAALPRYTDGEGVQAFVVAQGTYAGGAKFQITYTNQSGQSGRISGFCTSNISTTAGTVISSGTANYTYGWNIPLAQGDSGIRSVQSFTFITPNSGIFALVLCRPLGMVTIRETNVAVEKDFLIDTGLNMPQIVDGAYLHFLACPSSSLAASPILGSIQTVWG